MVVSWDFLLGLKHVEPTEMLMSWLENPHKLVVEWGI
jgi:hypothetical protein